MGKHRLDEAQKAGAPVVVVKGAPTPETPNVDDRATLQRHRSEQPKR